MLKELSHASAVISMEALSGGAATDKAASRLPSFLLKAAEFLNKSLISPVGDFLAVKDLSWMAANASRWSYSDLRGLEVVTPEGFQGSLVDYGVTLTKAVKIMEDLDTEVLQPYYSWVCSRLENPDSLKSLTNSLRIPGMSEPKYKDVAKSLEKFFPEKKTNLSPNYGEVFRRQNDWLELNTTVKNLNTIYQSPKYDETRRKVTELTHVLGVLTERLSSNDLDYKTSSVVIDQLATTTLNVAAAIEFYGLLRVRTDEYIRSVNATVNAVRDQLD